MFINGSFEKARQYIESHSKQPVQGSKNYEFFPCITISRETGAGADIVSRNLVEYFSRYHINNAPEWTVFDKNLIKKVLEDHHLPMHLQKLMEEQRYSIVTSLMTELLTGEPSALSLMRKTSQTILNLARIGNVIIIGRGSNFITAKLKNSFHIRLIAPIEQRISHTAELYQLTRKEASDFIKRDDLARKHYVATYFRDSLDNPMNYHLIINTGLVSHSDAAKIIGKAVVKKFRQVFINNILNSIKY